jgi:hypothetical protein
LDFLVVYRATAEDPEWMLEHGASAGATSKLPADRSVTISSTTSMIRRVGRSWRMRCHGAARTSRLALDCPQLAGA